MMMICTLDCLWYQVESAFQMLFSLHISLVHMLDLSVSGILRSCFFKKLTYNIENIYVIKTHCLCYSRWLACSQP